MTPARLIVLMLCLLMATAGALADGKVFARIGPDPTIPDQQALIHFDGSIQTLAIETRFEGDGTDFAWVVPLPALPEISAATSGLFPTLRAVFTPELADPDTSMLGFILFVGIFVAIAVLLAAARRWRATAVLGFFLVFIPLLIVVLLPALGKARSSSAGPMIGMTVHERRLVGDYETTTISSSDVDALVNWLDENGFAMPAAASPAIASYVQDGWVFVAVRLARRESRGISTPHPLVFRFATDACIYPMRLTGVQDEPISLELFIFASGRAEAPHMSTRRCAQVSDGMKKAEAGSLLVRHSALAELIGSAEVATRLSGRLTPVQMRQDLAITFHPFRARGNALYSPDAAVLMSAITGVAGFILVSAVVAVRSGRRRDLNASVSWLAGPLALAIVLGGGLYLALPKAEHIQYGRWGPERSIHQSVHIDLFLAIDVEEEDNPPFVPDVEWARATAALFHSSFKIDKAIIHEDSPGNYIIRERDGALEYVWYDGSGRENVEWLWSPKQSRNEPPPPAPAAAGQDP